LELNTNPDGESWVEYFPYNFSDDPNYDPGSHFLGSVGFHA